MRVVFKGRVSGLEIVIRYLEQSDVSEMHRYINEISKEKTYISYQGENVTLGEEESYISEQVKKIEARRSVNLVVFSGEKLIGTTHLTLGNKTNRHIAQFGITISQDYRAKGIGKLLMRATIEEGIKTLRGLEIVTLGVFANNNLAHHMYEDFGFKDYGKLINGVKLPNGYTDHIFMYKSVKKI